MQKEAERAACHQTLGFCVRMVELVGGEDVVAEMTAQGWEGAPRTIIAVRWREPSGAT